MDAFYIGGTKNGMLMGEAIVICGHGSHAQRLRESFPFLQKERGGLLAKGFLLGAQFEAAFADAGDGSEVLYWQLARHANECATRLREGLVAAGYELYGNSTSNQVFVTVSEVQEARLAEAAGCETFYVLEDGRRAIRFVCSWATAAADVDELLALARELA